MNPILKATIIASGIVFAGSAHAETAAEFLQSLEGDFSGRGNAIVIGDKTQRIACRISSVFDPEAIVLNVTGECAGTKGKSKINGGVAAQGEKLKGSFLSPRKGMTVTQSFGSLQGDSMQLSTSMVEEEAGRLVKIRQIISKTENGINAKFFTYSNSSKTYEPTGEIELKKTGAEEASDG